VPPRGPARPQPALEAIWIGPCNRCQVIHYAWRQITRRFQKPTGLPVVHQLGRGGQSCPRMLRREKPLLGLAQPPPPGRVRRT
jgi:hypothetical protein